MSNQGILYVIATPIGNLADITLRALDTIKRVEIILAEDTRVTGKLLEHYGIRTKLESLHDFNESKRVPVLIKRLLNGVDIGLVSDAGTPLISDPGYKLVALARREGIQVRPIPGASAVVAALSVAGIPTDRFVFEGFLPRKTVERQARLLALQHEIRSMVFYESPHRIRQLIQACIDVFGRYRKATLLRELTKRFEQHFSGKLVRIQQALHESPKSIKGEYVLVVSGNKLLETVESVEKAQLLLADLQKYISHKNAVEIVAKHAGLKRNQLYTLALKNTSKS